MGSDYVSRIKLKSNYRMRDTFGLVWGRKTGGQGGRLEE